MSPLLTGRHVMVDTETLSLSAGGIVMQLGAAEFLPEQGVVTRVFRRYVSLGSSMAAGRTLDPDTFLYWLEAEDAARLRLAEGLRSAVPLAQALHEFSDWVVTDNGRQGLGRKTEQPDGVWSHGAAFDVPLLQENYASVGQKEPWGHRAVYDTRTVFALAGVRMTDYEEKVLGSWPTMVRPHVAHCAESDAVYQALALMLALGSLQS